MSMSLLLGWGAYARDKNISARLCAKKVGGGAYARGGAYLRDTTVYVWLKHSKPTSWVLNMHTIISAALYTSPAELI